MKFWTKVLHWWSMAARLPFPGCYWPDTAIDRTLHVTVPGMVPTGSFVFLAHMFRKQCSISICAQRYRTNTGTFLENRNAVYAAWCSHLRRPRILGVTIPWPQVCIQGSQWASSLYSKKSRCRNLRGNRPVTEISRCKSVWKMPKGEKWLCVSSKNDNVLCDILRQRQP